SRWARVRRTGSAPAPWRRRSRCSPSAGARWPIWGVLDLGSGARPRRSPPARKPETGPVDAERPLDQEGPALWMNRRGPGTRRARSRFEGAAMSKHVLMALTSRAELGETGEPTGYTVPEAARPWKVFRDAGVEVDFVSVEGGEPPHEEVDED